MKEHKSGTYKIIKRNLSIEDAVEFNTVEIDKHTRIIEVFHPDGKNARGIYQSNSESMSTAQRRIEAQITA